MESTSRMVPSQMSDQNLHQLGTASVRPYFSTTRHALVQHPQTLLERSRPKSCRDDDISRDLQIACVFRSLKAAASGCGYRLRLPLIGREDDTSGGPVVLRSCDQEPSKEP